MSMKLGEIIKAYELKVPLSMSFPEDANGLKIGSETKEIHKIYTCLELTEESVQEAIAFGADVIFVHHDPLYRATRFLKYDDAHTMLMIELIKSDIALYVSHTNLDVVENGLNDFLFEKLGVKTSKVLETNTNLGRYGYLDKPMTVQEYIETVIEPLQQSFRLTKCDINKEIQKIAFVNGSGASYLKLAALKKADLFITGDVDYHTAMFAEELGLPILDIGHDFEKYVSILFENILLEAVSEQKSTVEVKATTIDYCPWINL